ncbi:MAG TPA: cold shock domain-containing protein [Candidatus Acidoferrum sp.]|nr:cold shock domain-containing protein [Candidatus Acidoferrum sp.]
MKVEAGTEQVTDQISENPFHGVVRWFDPKKGYGFIRRRTTDLSIDDIFVHHSAIQMDGYRTLNEGDEVEFVVKNGPKGTFAANVRKFR